MFKCIDSRTIHHFPVVFISPTVAAMRMPSSADRGGGAYELLIDRWSSAPSIEKNVN